MTEIKEKREYNNNLEILKDIIFNTLGKDDRRNDIILTGVIIGLFLCLRSNLLTENVFYDSLKWVSSLVVIDTGVKRFKETISKNINENITR
ncbi:MAG: hypothetical protein ACOCRK_02055 [bacterium]